MWLHKFKRAVYIATLDNCKFNAVTVVAQIERGNSINLDFS